MIETEELIFPDDPYIGQIYSQNGKSWKWNGYSWESYNQPVVDKNVKVVEGEYVIDHADGNTVLLSGEGETVGYVILDEETDDELGIGFRFEIWRVNARIGFSPDEGINVIAPDGLWVIKPGGRATIMKVGKRLWMVIGDLSKDPDSDLIQAESDEYIATDNF